MDIFNSIISIVREAMPLVQSGIPAIVGGFITAMFLRGNTNRSEFEKIKAGKMGEAIDDLVSSKELTLTELVKCKNLLTIAELADKEYASNDNTENDEVETESFDFDWFLRFFEAAGNVSDGDMQILWARILAGEVRNAGKYSLRTIDTLHNLSKKEAEAFRDIVEITFVSGEHPFIHDISELNFKYLGNMKKLMLLVECGLIMTSSIIERLTIRYDSSTVAFHNGVVHCVIETNSTTPVLIKLGMHPFTQAGIDLYNLINDSVRINFQYALDAVRAYKIIQKENLSITVKAMGWALNEKDDAEFEEIVL